ncbi:MAG: hypothetical protein U0350_34335 [Caldilineaceae bacterium]
MFWNQQKSAWLGVVVLVLLSLSACTMPLPTLNTLTAAKRNADFSKQLMAAITQRNDEKMQQMMSDKFMWVSWGGEESKLPAAVALVKARTSYFTQRSPIAFSTNKDWTSLLETQNPLNTGGAEVKVAATIYATGLGDTGKDEAILMIAQKPDGSRYWYGMLAASGGFAHQPANNVQTTVVPPQTSAPVARTAVLTQKSAITSTAQAVDAQRIQFAAGALSHDLQAHLVANGVAQYVLSAKAGQVMQVAIVAPRKNVFLSITGVTDGVTYKAAVDKAATWRGVLPSTQDYQIQAVTSGGETDYNLHVVIK